MHKAIHKIQKKEKQVQKGLKGLLKKDAVIDKKVDRCDKKMKTKKKK